jgi:hypothetical protein
VPPVEKILDPGTTWLSGPFPALKGKVALSNDGLVTDTGPAWRAVASTANMLVNDRDLIGLSFRFHSFRLLSNDYTSEPCFSMLPFCFSTLPFWEILMRKIPVLIELQRW